MGRTVRLQPAYGYAEDLPLSVGVEIGKLHGIGARSEQQDAYGIAVPQDYLSGGVMAVLADGMGGMSGGAAASTAAVVACLTYYDESDFDGSREQFEGMVRVANDEVVKALGADAGLGGTTLIAAMYSCSALSFVSVGDSAISLYRGGTLSRLNTAHTYGAELDELARLGQISVQAAATDPERRSITSFLGQEEVRLIDYGFIPVYSGDVVVIMSDGVFGTVDDAMLRAALAEPVSRAAAKIDGAIAAAARSNQDNYTALLVHVI